jgi:tetratricopeptide (TPR) repeat protein
VHTDSGCLSFTIALNQRNDDYQGGGTWFEGLQQTPRTKLDDGDDDNKHHSVLEMNVGQVTIRPGGVRHCGHAVTQGVRYIIGGFCMRVDKMEPVRQLLGLASELLQQQDETNPDYWTHIEQLLYAALTLNPYFDGIYTHLARLYQKCRQPEKARQVLEHCHAHVNPKSGEVAYSLGLLCLEQGDYDQVQSCMRVCLEADANDIDAMALMAQVISQRRLQQRESSESSSSLQMKTASDKKEEDDDEENWYRRIVQNPSATPTQLASAYCNLGVLHEGREDEVQLYQTSLEHDSSNFATWYSLACALAAQQHHEPAAHAFRQALDRIGDEDTEEHHQSQVLHALYRSAVAQLRQQPPNRFSSQQETIEELKRIMGEGNYHLLAAMTR